MKQCAFVTVMFFMCQLPLLALLAADRFGGLFFVYDQRAMTLIRNL